MAKNLSKYMKKNKVDPFKGDKGGKGMKGPDAMDKADQSAKTSGKKVTDDGKDYAETDPAKAGKKMSTKSQQGKGKKLRSYLDC